MPPTRAADVSIGAPVVTSDGRRIGDVVDAASHYVVVEKGLLFTTDLHLPFSTIADADGDAVRLALTEREIENGHWTLPPPPPVPAGRGSGGSAGSAGSAPSGPPRYVGVGLNGENGYDHHAVLKKP